MYEDDALIVIYRSLRDSICENISSVSYNNDAKEITLSLKGKVHPYEKDTLPSREFDDFLVKINKDSLFPISSKSYAPKRSGFFAKIFGRNNA